MVERTLFDQMESIQGNLLIYTYNLIDLIWIWFNHHFDNSAIVRITMRKNFILQRQRIIFVAKFQSELTVKKTIVLFEQ